MQKEDAVELLEFSGLLLKLLFEFPSPMKAKYAPKPGP
jgi:hypothetical protein